MIIYSLCVRLIHLNSANKIEVEPNKILTEQEPNKAQNTSNNYSDWAGLLGAGSHTSLT